MHSLLQQSLVSSCFSAFYPVTGRVAGTVQFDSQEESPGRFSLTHRAIVSIARLRAVKELL